MATYETCGNDYDKAFKVVMKGATHTFDSLEYAIHALAADLQALRHAHRRKASRAAACSIAAIIRAKDGVKQLRDRGSPRLAKHSVKAD